MPDSLAGCQHDAHILWKGHMAKANIACIELVPEGPIAILPL